MPTCTQGRGSVLMQFLGRQSPHNAFQTRRRSNNRCRVQAMATRSLAPPLPKKVSGSLVYPAKGEVKGVCHFLGGAFACAAPQVVYPLMIDSITTSGYTVIATPFAITFKHQECATKLHKEFWNTLDEVRSSSLSYCAPADTPIHGVGHSMGALMHLLIGCFCETPSKTSNIIISTNNKEIEGAVPIPGLFDTLRSTLMAYDSLPLNPFPDPIALLKDVTSVVLETSPNQPIKDLLIPSIPPIFDQIDSVLGELREGVSDFIPAPMESRSVIQNSYNVPATLMVKFSDDSIDETDEIMGLLKNGRPIRVDGLQLDGNHLTPIGGNLEWLGLDGSTGIPSQLNEISGIDSNRRLAEGVIQWMDTFVRVDVSDEPVI
ncbi:hypothetical protein BSKO_09978 [Bryopsis sp. KO-2023]|nr:hypothetical protein BSKO_09978 [Bryopsis sp. KO-2023]